MINTSTYHAITIPAGSTAGGGVPVDCSHALNWVIYYTSAGTTSGGTIIIEEADSEAYGGTWSQIESRAASSFTGGVTLAVHLPQAAYGFIRARISSAVTGGGTITVALRGTP